ncbi:MAG TPA: hypothetical protein VG942_12775 [Hyphomonadaceae bacterium]|nr:hypothetical protein [Hyphomonadaceae bacterium]
MLKRLSLLAAAGLMAAACANNPAPAPGPGTTSATPSPSASAGTATVLNVAGTTQWSAEERLMPQDPILALVNASGGTVDQPQGFWMTCNPSNGQVTAHLGKQPAGRLGQTASYQIRVGAGSKEIEGKFAANPKAPDPDFVFTMASSDLLNLSQLDMMSVVTDGGEVQWAFVKDPATKVQAKYVGSMKDMTAQAKDFLTWCNPK